MSSPLFLWFNLKKINPLLHLKFILAEDGDLNILTVLTVKLFIE